MDSIKNAIVTVTLLAVGYGSYVVLQDDLPAKPAQEDAALSGDADVGLLGESAGSLAVTVGEPAGAHVSDASRDGAERQQQNPALNAPAVNVESPLPANPFGDSAFANSVLEPPVAERVIPAEEILLEAPAQRMANTGAFAPPVVASVDVDPALAADVNASITKSEFPATSLAPSVMNESIGPVPPANAAEGSLAFEQDWAKAQQEVRQQVVAAALATLSQWVNDPTLNQEQRDRCLQLSDQLAGTVIYSREHHLEPQYVVKAGETLAEIAASYRVPQELLAKINGIAPPFALATGEELKVIPGPFRAEISVVKKELSLFLGSYYAGRFPVAIGPDLPPEESIYEVAEKTNGRSYFNRRTGHEVTLGEQTNRYGNHWLGLRGEHITTGHSVGIHGRSLQSPAPYEGSISLDPLDAADIYAILSVGSPVVVRR